MERNHSFLSNFFVCDSGHSQVLDVMLDSIPMLWLLPMSTFTNVPNLLILQAFNCQGQCQAQHPEVSRTQQSLKRTLMTLISQGAPEPSRRRTRAVPFPSPTRAHRLSHTDAAPNCPLAEREFYLFLCLRPRQVVT